MKINYNTLGILYNLQCLQYDNFKILYNTIIHMFQTSGMSAKIQSDLPINFFLQLCVNKALPVIMLSLRFEILTADSAYDTLQSGRS
jgi:hypothetical protein